MPIATETTLEIDLNALANNYNFITAGLKPETKIMAVVKAYGYGSDAVAVAKELVSLGVDYFAVAYASEGEVLRIAGIETPILVLHPLPANFDVIIDRCLEPSIYSQKMLTDFISFSEKRKQKDYPVHLKFNTGLNRLGFRKNEISFISETISKTEAIRVKSAFSHLAASEDASEEEFTREQLKSFRSISEELKKKINNPIMLHVVNTSGVLNYPEAQLDMIRTGIGLYGFGNDPEQNKHLTPVTTLKTVISQIHEINKGESVGYNRGLKANKIMKTATLPIGHADGLSRAYGNGNGWVTIHGKKAPIAGNVCMDMIMVDVSDIDCKEGDEVIVFGKNPTAESLANAINSISYELITAVSQRVKRVICRK
ncbi:alanine racemase [Ulvibacter antarcticus]|uniref:Alanine racemase n=1 Tax=Ulvibacter antarcticus TaxID=442714 RepID=A0A3L9YZK1_9FLAO|nr:alanine racemase [Ulvibacter antarcticus]RMA66066.1 alanine racemase [Ulvibacter antarcticus]